MLHSLHTFLGHEGAAAWKWTGSQIPGQTRLYPSPRSSSDSGYRGRGGRIQVDTSLDRAYTHAASDGPLRGFLFAADSSRCLADPLKSDRTSLDWVHFWPYEDDAPKCLVANCQTERSRLRIERLVSRPHARARCRIAVPALARSPPGASEQNTRVHSIFSSSPRN